MSEELNLENADVKIKIGDDEVSLSDLAGLDISDVKAKRFENLPEGFYTFDIPYDPAPTLKQMGEKGGVVIPLKVVDVHALKDGSIDASVLIGKTQDIVNLINNRESLEYLMALLVDLQASGFNNLLGCLRQLSGTRFKAHITHRTNKNDKDKVYAGLKKIEVLSKGTASNVAAGIAA